MVLEELIRAAAGGHEDGRSATVEALLQARIAALPAGARLLLRAASVFGETFWRGGVRALLGDHTDGESITNMLRLLIEEELIERHFESRLSGDEEFGFRHALLREAGYELLPTEERQRGHRLTAEYLEHAGETDSLTLAEHYQKGGVPAQAFVYYARAAERAHMNDQLEAALTLAEQALSCGVSTGPIFGRVRAVQAIARGLLRLELKEARQLADEALGHLLPEDAWWYRLSGNLMVLYTFMGDAQAASVLGTAMIANQPTAATLGVCIEALGRAAGISLTLGLRELSRALMARLRTLAATTSDLDAGTYASIALAEIDDTRAFRNDPYRCFQLAHDSLAGFRKIVDRRNQFFALLFLGQAMHELGDSSGGETHVREALNLARRFGSAYDLTLAKLYLANVLATREQTAAQNESAALATELTQAPGLSPGLRCWAHILAAQTARRAGELERSEDQARRAIELTQFAPQRGLVARRALIDIRLAQGRTSEACGLAAELRARIEQSGGAGQAELGLWLCIALACAAGGDDAGAAVAWRNGREQLLDSAARIPDATWRARYLQEIPDHRRLLEPAEMEGLIR